MGPVSDGFLMNRLEEGTLGGPVLAGNLVYNLDGRGDAADLPMPESSGMEQAGTRGGIAARNPAE